MNILVAYLVAPGDEYGECATRFVESYAEHPAGLAHDLLIVQKTGSHWLPSTCAGFDQADHLAFVEHPNEGYDIQSLQRVCAGNFEYDQVCWLGSRSRILHDNWLGILSRVASGRAGAAAASGSFEAGVSQQRPNAHLRTNGLVIAPTLLNSLGFNTCYTRVDCYEFEHGIFSLYRRLVASGYQPMVAAADGCGYPCDLWAFSGTFRKGEQENLLIADRQTDAYMKAGPEERDVLTKMAGF